MVCQRLPFIHIFSKQRKWIFDMEKYRDIFDALNQFKIYEDGTYEVSTHQTVEFSNGYQVSFVRPEAFSQLAPKDWDVITNHLGEYLDSPAYIGVYSNSPEISFHTLIEDKATETMIRFNQESILLWEEKSKFPDFESFDRWFLVNNLFDEDMVVNYDEVLKTLQ